MTDELIPPGGAASDEKKKRKQAEKARGVWISFAGRIVAQIVGAVASVVPGIMVLQRYQAAPASGPASAPAAADAPAPRAATSRRPGQAAIAVPRLEQLAARGTLPPVLGFDPLFDQLRQDPRWAALARRPAPADRLPR